MPDCGLEGLYMTGVDTSESHAPAVRVYAGSVQPATISSNQQMGECFAVPVHV